MFAASLLAVFAFVQGIRAQEALEPYITENFNTKGLFYSGTDGGAVYSYTSKGTYRISTMDAGGVGLSLVSDNVADFEMTVKVRLVETHEDMVSSAAGVVFRVASASGSHNYYTFNIDTTGKFNGGKFVAGKFTRYYPGQESKEIAPSGWNVLKVRATGDYVQFFINGELVSKISDPALKSGGYGLYTTQGCVAEFDDFRLDLIVPEEFGGEDDPEGIEVPNFRYKEVMRDAFDGKNPLFYEGEDEYGGFHYTEHKSYRIDLSKAGWPTPSTAPGQLLDCRVSVSAYFIDAPKPERDHLGLIIRSRPRDDGWSDYYVFQIFASGKYGFIKVLGDKIKTIIPPTQSAAIKAGGLNRLQVVSESHRFYLLINESPVAVAEDGEIGRGGYGFYLSGGAVAEFQDFLVEAIQGRTDTTGMPEPKPDTFIDLSVKPNDYFRCDFENLENVPFAVGEKQGFTLEVTGGAYVIDALEADADAFSFLPGRFSSYKASVKAKWLEGSEKLGYGIVLQVTPSQTGYVAFLITNDGWYSVQRSVKGDVKPLVNWVKTDLIVKNEPNQLGIIRQGDNLTFTIGGEIVEMFPVDGLGGGGGLALVAGKGVKASFDDFVIASP